MSLLKKEIDKAEFEKLDEFTQRFYRPADENKPEAGYKVHDPVAMANQMRDANAKAARRSEEIEELKRQLESLKGVDPKHYAELQKQVEDLTSQSDDQRNLATEAARRAEEKYASQIKHLQETLTAKEQRLLNRERDIIADRETARLRIRQDRREDVSKMLRERISMEERDGQIVPVIYEPGTKRLALDAEGNPHTPESLAKEIEARYPEWVDGSRSRGMGSDPYADDGGDDFDIDSVLEWSPRQEREFIAKRGRKEYEDLIRSATQRKGRTLRDKLKGPSKAA